MKARSRRGDNNDIVVRLLERNRSQYQSGFMKVHE
jgi:hypothetical protein